MPVTKHQLKIGGKVKNQAPTPTGADPLAIANVEYVDENAADTRLSNVASDLTEQEKTDIKSKLGVSEGGNSFTDITENQFGTHPAFTNQHTLNAWLLGNSGGGGGDEPESNPPLLTVDNITHEEFDYQITEQ